MARCAPSTWRCLPGGLLAGALAAAALCPLAGCDATDRGAVAAMQKRMAALEDEATQLRQRVANQQETIEAQQRQIAKLQDLGPQRPGRLVPIQKLAFARMSGTYDSDNDGVPDGIVLYVQPTDAQGDVVKAAGELRVRLFDLAAPEGPRLIAEYQFGPEELKEIWYGRLWTEHFTARLPWPEGYRPAGRDVTARAEFTDYLTGRTFTEQQTYSIQTIEPQAGR